MTGHGSSKSLFQGGTVFDRLALIVFALFALLRIAYSFEAIDHVPILRQPLADAIVYVESAREVASGRILMDEPFYRAPLYSYLIAPFYALDEEPEAAIIAFQVFLGLLILFMTWRIARNLYGAAPALLSLVLVGLYGSMAASETKLLGTTLGLFLGTVALWTLTTADSRRGFFLAGVVLGLGALARPNVVLVVLAVAAMLLISRLSWRAKLTSRVIPMLLGVAFLVAPVTLHNLLAGDFVFVSSNGGMTFYHGNNSSNRSGLLVPGPLTPGGMNAVQQGRRDRARASELTGRQLRPSESSAFWFRQGLNDIASDPVGALRRSGQKVYRFLGAHEYADNYSLAVELTQVRLLHLFVVPFPLLLIPAVVALLRKPPRRREELYVLIFACLGFVTCMLFYVGSRYRCESVPALAILAGSILTTLPVASRPRRLLACAAAVPLVLVALVPAGRSAASQDAMAAAFWAGSLARDGRPEEARTLYADAARTDPSNPVAWARWAAFVTETEGVPAGVSILDSGISSGADGPILRSERGTLLIQLGDVEDAEHDLRLAHEARPLDPTARLNLAACLVLRGADEEAGSLLLHSELDLDPVALYYRGLLEMRQGLWHEAIDDFDAAIDAGARDPRPAFMRAMAWIRIDKREEAYAWLQDWLASAGCDHSAELVEEILSILGTEPSEAWLDSEMLGGPGLEALTSALAGVRRAWSPSRVP